jgi:hypothetical protein
MGLFASFAFHARDRDGPDRPDDHGKAQTGPTGRKQRRACAYLIALCLGNVAQADAVRVAYFHSELSRDGPGLLLRDILKGDEQVEAWLRVVAAVDPDVLVIGDIDFDLNGIAIGAVADRLGTYPHRFTKRPNRGLDSGRDLDGDGRLGGPGDAEGYGDFAGQGGMAILSRFQIDAARVRDLSSFLWADLPEALTVGDGQDPARLSTTAHWDVPVRLPDGHDLHLLVWHATAPVFDGPEDRNGRRNHDEARFWQVYLEGNLAWTPPERFVLLGTANADPLDGESRPGALRAILDHPLLHDPRPESVGGPVADLRDGGVNLRHRSPPEEDTVDWPDGAGEPGNLRVDYVLPASVLQIAGHGVFWPEPEASLGGDVALASRHRLVWVDIEIGDRMAESGAGIGLTEAGQ